MSRGLLLVLALAASAAAAQEDPVAAGKAIYRDGLLPSGKPLAATFAGGVRAEGSGAACARCHRRSGLGGAEGDIVIRPLAVPGFFEGQAGLRRPTRRGHGVLLHRPYDDAAFAAALREGRAADGRALHPLMPRYEVAAAEAAALRAYLWDVAARPAPGVTAEEIHFATVIAPDAEPAVREATLAVLQALVEARNAGTRREAQRRRAGLERMDVAWRKWVLHVWTLGGPPDTWGAQLEDRLRAQPVFAVLSGAGRAWGPVHDFCESRELPCLFPNVDLPGRPGPGQYTLYFSRGMLAEADVMARELARLGTRGPVWLLRRDDPRSAAAAAALRGAWRGELREAVLQQGTAPADGLPGGEAPAAVLLWLDWADLARLGPAALPADGPVFASGTLLGEDLPALPPALAERLRIVWPFALPGGQGHDRAQQWLAARGVAPAHRRTQANTYLAASLASEAIFHLADNWSREYFIERIEHSADRSLTSGAFPRIGLGPGQRYASNGAYLARLAGGTLAAVGDWIVP